MLNSPREALYHYGNNDAVPFSQQIVSKISITKMNNLVERESENLLNNCFGFNEM